MFKSKEVSGHWLITLASKYPTSVFREELQCFWQDPVAVMLSQRSWMQGLRFPDLLVKNAQRQWFDDAQHSPLAMYFRSAITTQIFYKR